ncbi:reverse transcriptase domain-containing protein [Tanacetum coccineum]
MLERLAGNEFYYFLDGFSGYFQIPIDPQDQEKTTFTYPYGTFAYRRMTFGLCNAPGTFQRCMVVIFHDMIEKTMEVFMDDFSIFGDSFSSCLSHLDMMLKSGIEVDRAKVDVIAKLPPSTMVKEIRSFLAPILVSPDWDLPFEIMCDASPFDVRFVLGQRKEKHFQPIHYASKTLSDAQTHYTTTEKELLAVVYAFEKLLFYLVFLKFDIEIRDKKGVENLTADHLSRLENPHQWDLVGMEINDNFPHESLNMISRNPDNGPPWFADIAKLTNTTSVVHSRQTQWQADMENLTQNGPTHLTLECTDPPPADSAVVPAPREKLDSEFCEEENKLEMADTQAEIILSQGPYPDNLFNTHNQTSTAKGDLDKWMLMPMISPQPTAQSPNYALMSTMTQIANLLIDHIVTEPVQRKAPGNNGNTGTRGKKVICYNCRGEGHVARQFARDMLQRFNMPTQTIPMLSKKPKKATADLHKDILGTRNPGLGYMAKRAQPVCMMPDTLLHPNHHHPVSILWELKVPCTPSGYHEKDERKDHGMVRNSENGF